MPTKGVSNSYPIGKRFGRVMVCSSPVGGSGVMCECDCGDVRIYYMANLRTQKEPMCPECRTASRPAKGNSGKHPLFNTWKAMVQRCENPNHTWYKRYGGRGIRVCQEWRKDFEKFAKDVGERPEGTTLDRINGNGNYEPGNVRWADAKTQQNNRKGCAQIEWDGKLNTLTELAAQAVVDVATLSYRLRSGWGLDIAMRTPSKGNGKRGKRKPLDDDGNPV